MILARDQLQRFLNAQGSSVSLDEVNDNFTVNNYIVAQCGDELFNIKKRMDA